MTATIPSPAPLLAPDEPPPAAVVNPDGASPFLLVGDHAGRRIPAALGTLGLGEDELSRHIGWDIGVARLGTLLAGRLDALLVHQRYSRLVIDCNRQPDRPDAVPPVSDGTAVPGNQGLSATRRQARVAAIHAPYHAAIAAALARRRAAAQATVLVSLHSFTPALRTGGASRPWQAGVLHDRGDPRFALRLLAGLRATPGLVVGDNEPYAMAGIDYTVPRHAYAAGLPYAEIELRQDLLATEADLLAWCDTLASALTDAIGRPA